MGLSLKCRPDGFAIDRRILFGSVNRAAVKALTLVGKSIRDDVRHRLAAEHSFRTGARSVFAVETTSTGHSLKVSIEADTPTILLRSGRTEQHRRTSMFRLRLLQRSGRLAGVARELGADQDAALREAVLQAALEHSQKTGGLMQSLRATLT